MITETAISRNTRENLMINECFRCFKKKNLKITIRARNIFN